jgi:hypothetical protein
MDAAPAHACYAQRDFQAARRFKPREHMTMHRLLFIAFLALLPATAILARAEDLATARKAIEAQYERLDAATVRKDASPPEGVLDAGLQAVTVEGDELDHRLWTSAWEQGVAALETVTVQSKIQSLTVEGDTARAVVHTVLEGTLKETPGKMRIEVQQQDTWVTVISGWRLQRTVETSRKVLLDGVLARTSRPLRQWSRPVAMPS